MGDMRARTACTIAMFSAVAVACGTQLLASAGAERPDDPDSGPPSSDAALADTADGGGDPCVAGDAGPAVLAQSKTGFSGVQGGCGWSFLHCANDAPDGAPNVAQSATMTRYDGGRWFPR